MTQLTEQLRAALTFRAKVLPFKHFPVFFMGQPEDAKDPESIYTVANEYLNEALRYSQMDATFTALEKCVAALEWQECEQDIELDVKCRPNQPNKCKRCQALADLRATLEGNK